MKVIVADDSGLVRSLVKKAIAPLGYDSIPAVHGGQVMEILESSGSDIDAILMDWNMPTMDGFQALNQVKGDPRFNAIPVIMLTSESDEKKIKRAFDAGASGYVEKPFTAEELLENLKKIVDGS